LAKKLVKLERWLSQWQLTLTPVDPQEGESDAYELTNETGQALARLHQQKGKPTVFWKGLWEESAGDGQARSFVGAVEGVLYCFGIAHGHIGNLKRPGGKW
jgi:hypothetical protein